MTDLTVTQTLQPSGPATALVLTDEQVEELGGGKRAAVMVRIGDRQARLRLAVMGGQNLIGMSKATRAELGVDFGDEVTATITLDEAPREVEVPAELSAAFATDPGAAAAYEKLAFTHRKEYARWVGEAKKGETRQRRAAEALQMLREGRTRS
jgi:uncharacterized protein YdeI (YjbR/CyaY-like superfamily)